MWGPFARLIDRVFIRLAARRYGQFFGQTTDADYTRSLHDELRLRMKREARLTSPPDGAPPTPTAYNGRRTKPTARHTIQIDRGGDIVETTCNYYALGHYGRLLIVYHHGLGEIPNELSFRQLLLRERGGPIPADMICYHATGHRTPHDVGQAMSTLRGFTTLLGDGMMSARAIARAYRRHYDRVVFVGSSLGGMVGIVEAALSASFDLNVAMIAHPDMVHCIGETAFRRLIDPDFLARCPRDLMRIGQDADRLLAAAQRRLVMINGIHDEYFRIEVAREFWSRFGQIDAYEIPHGHVSVFGATKTIKRTLLTALANRRMLA